MSHLYLRTTLSVVFDFKLSLTEQQTYHTAVQVFKIIRKITPPYLHDTFSYAVDVICHIGRNPHRFYVPSIRTNYGRKSLWYQSTVIWNNLSLGINTAKSLTESKSSYCALM